MTVDVPDSDRIKVRCLTSELAPDFLRFFDRAAFADNPAWRGCYCCFHYHDKDNGAWEARTSACNREAMTSLIASGMAEGYLAYDGGDVVGWCNAAPKSLFPELRRLPGNAADTAFVPCFVVAPAHRRQGVARRLLEAACESLRVRGFTRLLARPVRGAATAADNHTGPLPLFLGAGFRVMFEDELGNVYVEKRMVAHNPAPAPDNDVEYAAGSE